MFLMRVAVPICSAVFTAFLTPSKNSAGAGKVICLCLDHSCGPRLLQLFMLVGKKRKKKKTLLKIAFIFVEECLVCDVILIIT